jgi:hypothetical protein
MHVVVGIGVGPQRAELVEHPLVERVELLRTVQRDRENVSLDIGVDGGQAGQIHWGSYRYSRVELDSTYLTK